MSRAHIDTAVEAFCRQIEAEGTDFTVERGPKGGWLFRSEETISLDRALNAAIRAAIAREKSRTAIAAELSEWKEERRERP